MKSVSYLSSLKSRMTMKTCVVLHITFISRLVSGFLAVLKYLLCFVRTMMDEC